MIITTIEAKKMGLKRHYPFSDLQQPIFSQWGWMPIAEWLEKEKARMEANPHRKAEVVEQYGLRALYVNQPYNTIENIGDPMFVLKGEGQSLPEQRTGSGR